jgi:hypothetical protein
MYLLLYFRRRGLLPARGSSRIFIEDLDGHQTGSTKLDGRTVRCQLKAAPVLQVGGLAQGSQPSPRKTTSL